MLDSTRLVRTLKLAVVNTAAETFARKDDCPIIQAQGHVQGWREKQKTVSSDTATDTATLCVNLVHWRCWYLPLFAWSSAARIWRRLPEQTNWRQSPHVVGKEQWELLEGPLVLCFSNAHPGDMLHVWRIRVASQRPSPSANPHTAFLVPLGNLHFPWKSVLAVPAWHNKCFENLDRSRIVKHPS